MKDQSENTSIDGLDAPKDRLSEIIATSPEMQHVLRIAGEAAKDNGTSILLLGESGTGKGLLAEYIHLKSRRANGPLISINCGAPNPSLIEDELFGHEKGGFTGAITRKKGVFEQAHGGTLFLDEIGDLPSDLQVKLFRVLDKRVVRRLGSTDEIAVDMRILSATNLQVEDEILKGRFRQELYFRINVVTILIPPVRARAADILPLATHFFRKFAEEKAKAIHGMTPQVEAILQSYAWPGNVRELQNAIECAVVMEKGHWITADSLPSRIIRPSKFLVATAGQAATKKQDYEPANRGSMSLPIECPAKTEIEDALIRSRGNATLACEFLGISRDQLRRRLYYQGIDARSFKRRRSR